jgi:uncharacterized protein DUF4760
MTAEWVTAIATAGTFVVIAASAVAALVQLRHMRGSNQIVALTEIRETLESAEFEAAMKYIHRELPRRLQDPDVRKRLLEQGSSTDEFIPIRVVCNFFESFGAFVKRGIIDRDIACDLYGPPVLVNWEILAPFIFNKRTASNNPSLFENFEYLAAISTAWNERHPNGAYPKHAMRMPQPEYWPELKAEGVKA